MGADIRLEALQDQRHYRHREAIQTEEGGMKEYINKLFCYIGWHDWHYFSRIQGETLHPNEMRRCTCCSKSETLGRIIIKDWR
tara:strand:+ start:25718 stop:25966 length:249 start_codon:yes stop_codon:yes gene_type:complete